ncbi:PTS glucose transporter subunit IIA [Gleimia sp. 6138-11-ORH1]|uniref:PTS sugar transporter subunit IIA n=1 Tax=Gleimia sp. 6138-11-ORH1 TaxID=2973937 RepID=UPI002169DDB6|nr:PTS glucose transporter subunit IIA [Gleimia sp. 6138-11-ORH1]MCS4484924.1 PTS glucose transporter subunit IIA [Gleimia sp. 6138-11-ORH1]
MLQVFSPLTGVVKPLSDVKDPVLAEEIIGAGLAVYANETRIHEVCAPVSGRLLKVHPHAFLIFTPIGIGILVHLGVETVTLKGKGFTVLCAEGDTVELGTPIVRWDPQVAIDAGLDTTISVVACNVKRQQIFSDLHGHMEVAQGEEFFHVVSA